MASEKTQQTGTAMQENKQNKCREALGKIQYAQNWTHSILLEICLPKQNHVYVFQFYRHDSMNMFTASTWPYKQKILKIGGTFVYWGYKWGYKRFYEKLLTININHLN